MWKIYEVSNILLENKKETSNFFYQYSLKISKVKKYLKNKKGNLKK